MKLVKSIVRSEKVNEIASALEDAGASGLTVLDVHGRGRHTKSGVYRGVPYPVLVPMCMIDVIVPDDSADDIVRILIEHEHTGQVGDGHVMVMPLEELSAVRTRFRHVAS